MFSDGANFGFVGTALHWYKRVLRSAIFAGTLLGNTRRKKKSELIAARDSLEQRKTAWLGNSQECDSARGSTDVGSTVHTQKMLLLLPETF